VETNWERRQTRDREREEADRRWIPGWRTWFTACRVCDCRSSTW